MAQACDMQDTICSVLSEKLRSLKNQRLQGIVGILKGRDLERLRLGKSFKFRHDMVLPHGLRVCERVAGVYPARTAK